MIIDEAVRRTLERFPEVAAAYLFGSHAGERHRPSSDVDVAIIFAEAVAAERRFEVRCILSEQIARAVGVATADVVDLEAAPPLLAHDYLTVGHHIVHQLLGRLNDLTDLAQTLDKYARRNAEPAT